MGEQGNIMDNCPYCEGERHLHKFNCKSCQCRTRLDYEVYVPEGYKLVPDAVLEAAEYISYQSIVHERYVDHNQLSAARDKFDTFIKSIQEKT